MERRFFTMKTTRLPLFAGVLFGILFLAGHLATMAPIFLSDDFNEKLCFDFGWRYNEIDCVLSGINPYDIADGSVDSDEFRSWIPEVARSQSGKRSVGGYPPWEYAVFAPFAIIPMRLSFILYTTLEISALVLCGYFSYKFAVRSGLDGIDARLAGFAPTLLAWNIATCLRVGNFGIFLGFAVFALAEFLNRRRDILAGACLALLFVKPHLTLFFTIPILMGRRFKTILIAASLCMLLSVPTSLAVRHSPISLTLDVFLRHASQPFRRIAFLPEHVGASILEQLTPQGFIVCSLIVSLFWIFRISHRIHASSSDWYIRLAPCAIIAPLWAYSQPHDTNIHLLPMSIAVTGFLRLTRPLPCRGGPPFPADFGKRGKWLLFAIAGMALLCPAFLVADPSRSRFPEVIGFHMSLLDTLPMSNIGKLILSLPGHKHLFYWFFAAGNLVMLIAWALLFRQMSASSNPVSTIGIAPKDCDHDFRTQPICIK